MHQIEGIQERGRDGHGAVEASAALLLALKGQDRRLDIDPIGRQCQGLRGTTARIQQRPAIGADLPGSGFGGAAERVLCQEGLPRLPQRFAAHQASDCFHISYCHIKSHENFLPCLSCHIA